MSISTISQTDFRFAGQKNVYHGKVRDVYEFDGILVMVATDRISAFDVILPRPIPHKGQVLNQLAAYFLTASSNIVPNWLIATPDPNVSIGHLCKPFKVEVVVRDCLVGHAWREYTSGKRELCGVSMPDGMKQYDRFNSPIITPATKAEAGHDEDISANDVVSTGLATYEQWEEIADVALKLFAQAQQMAARRGLYLADTKYEFGTLDSTLHVIDEIHTPDSSRYFYGDSYNDFVIGKTTETPRHLSKEFVREWLLTEGFSGQPEQKVPQLSDEFIQNVSNRYIELYEVLTGEQFVPADYSKDPMERIKINIEQALINRKEK